MIFLGYKNWAGKIFVQYILVHIHKIEQTNQNYWINEILCFPQIQEFNEAKQGRNGPGFHWLVFPGASEDGLKSSSENYTLNEEDHQKVYQKQRWHGFINFDQLSSSPVRLHTLIILDIFWEI